VYTVCLGRDGRYALSGSALYCGFYLNELLMRLMERNDPHAELFSYYLEALTALSGTAPLQETLRFFEVRLLKSLGYELILERDVESGDAVESGVKYDFLIEQGPVRSTTREISSPLRVDGRTLLCLQGCLPMDTETQSESKGLMRSILAHYLGGKPLKSRELFRGLSK
jgi:DNA repair protein RecO (recombination protein O)